MKKIGIFIGKEPPYAGGQSHYIQTLLDAAASLPRNEFSVVAVYINPAWEPYLKKTGFRFVRAKNIGWKLLGGVWLALKFSGRLWRGLSRYLDPTTKTVLRERCALWVFPSQDIWASQLPVPTLVVVHDLMHRYEPSFPEVSKFSIQRFRDNYLREECRKAVGIFVDSEIGKKHVQESYGIVADKIHCLPYVPNQHLLEANSAVDINKKYGLPKKFVFYPAQFWSHKNHIRLIDAIEKIQQALPDICLVLVGSKKGQYGNVLTHVQKKNLNGRVVFTGYVPDEEMPHFYKQARALVMPTFFGPTNIPPLEAMALGCPVATSRIYAMPAQLGDAALWFDPKSVNQIAECLLRLWSDDALCESLRQKGRQRAAQWGPAQFNARFRAVIDLIV